MLEGVGELLSSAGSGRLGLGYASRAASALALVAESIAASLLPGPGALCSMALVLVSSIAIQLAEGKSAALLRASGAIAAFIAISAALNTLSAALSLAPVSLQEAATGALRVAALTYSFVLAVTWVSHVEAHALLARLGLGRLGELIAISFSKLPVLLEQAGEARTAIELKYGKRGVHMFVVPLIARSLELSDEAAVAHELHGMPEPTSPALNFPRDALAYLPPLLALLPMLVL
ncbi:MAG: hypothetical protein ABWK00_03675 [Desulfurococcaceae archaeon]